MVVQDLWDNKYRIYILKVYYFNEKLEMWENITRSRRNEYNRFYCVLGDLNAVRSKEERKGVNPEEISLREIRNLMILSKL